MKDRGLTDETDRHWYQVQRRTYCYTARELEVEELRSVTQAEVLEWYLTHLAPSSQSRKKISVRVVGRQHWAEDEQWENEVVSSGPQDQDVTAKATTKSPTSPRSSKRAKTSAATPAVPTKLRMAEVTGWRGKAKEWPKVEGVL